MKAEHSKPLAALFQTIVLLLYPFKKDSIIVVRKEKNKPYLLIVSYLRVALGEVPNSSTKTRVK
jgi:hypothetical protein